MAGRIFEREAEQEILQALVDGVRAGSGRLVVVEGAAGIGKTTLIREANHRALSGKVRVLRAVASELETGFPFGVVRQLLERALQQVEGPRRHEVVSGSAELAASLLGASDVPRSRDTNAHAAVHALYSLAVNLAAQQPLLLTVDDAHWADTASLQFLHYLGRRLDDVPIGLLLATRSVTQQASPSLVSALMTVEGAAVLRPAPLTGTAVAALTEELLGTEPEPAFVEACGQATGGNAFLLTALLRELARDGATPSAAAAATIEAVAPEAIRHRINGWLATLPGPVMAVARALAVLREADMALLAAQADVTPGVVREACSQLEQAGLLDNAQVLRFAHPLLAAAILGTISAGEASEAHLRAARLLADVGAPLDASAVHLLATRPAADPWVASLLASAAAAALAQGAPAEASGYLHRALAEPAPENERAKLLMDLGTAQLRMHHSAEAIATLRSARDANTIASLGTDIAIALSQAYFLVGDTEAAAAVLEEARVAAPDTERLHVLDGNAIALGLIDPNRLESPRARLAVYRAQVEAGQLHEPTLVALAGAESVLRAEPSAAGVAMVRRALTAGLSAFGEHTFAFGWAICAMDAADCSEEAIVWVDEALAEARPSGDAAITTYLLGYRTHLALRIGRLAEAEADGRAALELLRAVGGDVSFPVALLDVLLERDAAAEAWEIYEQESVTGSAQRSAMMELVGARVGAAVGRGRESLPRLLRAGEQLDAMSFLHPQFAPWRALAALLAEELGERDRARELAAQGLDLARQTGDATALSQALRIHGILDHDEPALEEAVALAAATPDRLEHARSLVALGSQQRQADSSAAARETLRRALSVAHEAGALRLVALARQELVAAGGRPRRLALTGIEALTPSELQVTRLARDGLGNRDISDALFVSVKTVEQHLARAYAKLGITGRVELANALAGRAVPEGSAGGAG